MVRISGSVLFKERHYFKLKTVLLSACFLVSSLACGLLTVSIKADAKIPFAVDGQVIPSLAPMLEITQPAVVNISTVTNVRVRTSNPFFDDPFFRRYFDIPSASRNEKRQGLGSGVIIDAREGLIVTNSHVIDKVDEISVTLKDGREFSATLVGSDKETDVAVIRIQASNLRSIPIGDSKRLRVGDFVVAIGNPFGLRQTVTSGIVSALGRSGLGIEGYEDFIQTDASINPGNSGGALVNLRGELVGINTAIIAPSGGSVGINFAIPINMVTQLTNQLVEYGSVQRGKLGIQVQDLTPKLAQALGSRISQGAVITHIEPNSSAERAGFELGDIVVSSNGKKIIDSASLRNQIGLVRVGGQIDMMVFRNGQQLAISALMSDIETDDSVGERLNERLAGATFSEMADGNRSKYKSAILVTKVERGTAAWYYGLRDGDIITAVNRQTVNDLLSFREALSLQDSILLNIIRDGNSAYILLQ